MPTKLRQDRKVAAVGVAFMCRWIIGMELTAAWMLYPDRTSYGARPILILISYQKFCH